MKERSKIQTEGWDYLSKVGDIGHSIGLYQCYSLFFIEYFHRDHIDETNESYPDHLDQMPYFHVTKAWTTNESIHHWAIGDGITRRLDRR